MADLVFEGTLPASTDLVFGAGVEAPATNVTLTGTLPALTVSLLLIPPNEVDVVAQLPAITIQVALTPNVPAVFVGTLPPPILISEVRYNSNTARPTVGRTENLWQLATKAPDGVTHGQQNTGAAPAGWAAFWDKTLGRQEGVVNILPNALDKTLRPELRGIAQDATGADVGALFGQQDATRKHLDFSNGFQDGTIDRGRTFFKHEDGTRTHRRFDTEFQVARLFHYARSPERHQIALILDKGWLTQHQDAVRPPPGISFPPAPPGPPAPQPCYFPGGDLVFKALWLPDTDLIFVCDNYVAPPPPPPPPPGQVVVPVQRVYIVVNSASLRRVSDNALIPAYSMSLSLDSSSWTWGFDCTIPMEAQALVEPTTGPVELQATINGVNFRVLAEQLSRERTFGRATLRVSGRGRNAILDSPYAPITTYQNTIERTAQQLAADVLTFNGVPLPWTVDWGLTDWLVPAEVFTHQGTHISALNAIAQAAGGYLQPHRTNQVIRILPKYPQVPWNWGSISPDFVLPSDVTTREGITWTDKPQYNRVFVSGQQQGILGQVTRIGTAGDLVAPLVTDPLITQEPAARQRGMSVLADTGRVVQISLSLPVLQATGIIDPGKFVRYTDAGIERLGLVRSTSVSVNGGAGSIKQDIDVESFA